MEYYNIFIKVLLKEVEKFHLNMEVISTQVNQLTFELKDDFNGPYNRCAYLYRHATAYMHAFNICTKKFFTEYFNTKDIFSMWKSCSEVKVCSLSVGPGLDYLGFMVAISEYDPTPLNFTGVKVVSRHGGWRNTTNLLKEVLSEEGSAFEVLCSKYQNVSVTQADLFTSTKITAVSEANVILMMKTLNFLSPNPPEELSTAHMLFELVSSLESGTIIFCIDTKPSISVLSEVLSQFPGQFLYDPSLLVVKVPGDFPEFGGIRPSRKVKGMFFVWQKGPITLTSNLCETPIKNMSFGTENKVDNLTVSDLCDKSVDSVIKTKVEVKKIDDNISLSLIEKFLNLAVEDSKSQIKEKDILNTSQTAKLEFSKVLSIPSQSKVLDLSLEQKNAVDMSDNLNSYSNGSTLSSDTLDSVSSITCEVTTSNISVQQRNTLPVSSGTLRKCNKLSETNPMKTDAKEAVMPKKNYSKLSSSQNKIIQTDTLLDVPTAQSSVKELTDKIRKLAISLESSSQHNGPLNSSGGDSISFNQRNERPGDHTHSTDKPSCSKQSPSSECNEPHSMTGHHSYMNAPCRNMAVHCTCQCSHNRCMNCCLQPIPRCSFTFNQHSRENNVANVTSPNIVIPLQNISDNALLQIISILKSESKN